MDICGCGIYVQEIYVYVSVYSACIGKLTTRSRVRSVWMYTYAYAHVYLYIFSMYATRAAERRRTRGAGCAGARMTLSRCCRATGEMRIRL